MSEQTKNLSRNRQIMARKLEGQSDEEIGRAVGLRQQAVSAILNSPLMKLKMEELRELMSEQIEQRVAGLGDEALDTVRDTMRGSQESELQFKAAKDLLDRHPGLRKKAEDGDAAKGLGEEIIRAISRKIAARSNGNHSPEEPQGEVGEIMEAEVIPDEVDRIGGTTGEMGGTDG